MTPADPALRDHAFLPSPDLQTPVEINAIPAVDLGLLSGPVSLRAIEPTDREWFLGALARSRESVGRWLPLNQSGESDGAFFDRQVSLCAEGERTRRACRRLGVLDDGTPFGMFSLNTISRGLSWEADAIWWVDANLRGNGLATRGVRALLDHAFADMPTGLGLHGVHCGIEPGNDASVRVATRCGFTHDPAKRSHLKVGERWTEHEFYLATPESFAATGSA